MARNYLVPNIPGAKIKARKRLDTVNTQFVHKTTCEFHIRRIEDQE